MARSKYGAVRTEVDGIAFHSKGEAQRWAELKLLERAGQISSLNRQAKFALNAENGNPSVPVGFYIADFAYIENGKLVVEDYSGFINALKRWKLRHFEAEYRTKVLLTGAASRKRAA